MFQRTVCGIVFLSIFTWIILYTIFISIRVGRFNWHYTFKWHNTVVYNPPGVNFLNEFSFNRILFFSNFTIRNFLLRFEFILGYTICRFSWYTRFMFAFTRIYIYAFGFLFFVPTKFSFFFIRYVLV